MTPGINSLKKANITYTIHKYKHDPLCNAYGEEAAEKLNVSPDRLFKTLVVEIDNKELAVAVVPVSMKLDLKTFSNVLKSKKSTMADKNSVERSTGYLTGGVSPVGQKKRLKTIIDISAKNFKTIYASAGRRGLQIELSPDDLCRAAHARFDAISK